MFRLIRRLITLAVVLTLVLVIVILILPKSYEREYLTNISKPRTSVFHQAKAMRTWNVAAMTGGFEVTLPEGLSSEVNIPGVNIDSLRAALKGFAEMANIRCRLIEAEPPQRLVYELIGGPLDGLRPEMTFREVEDKSTLVTLTEKYQFAGLLGGIKAFSAKFAMQKLNERNLENLKKLCEQTP